MEKLLFGKCIMLNSFNEVNFATDSSKLGGLKMKLMRLLKYIPLLTITVLLSLVSGCKPDSKHGNFTLDIKAKYGDQNFALGSIYTDPQNRRIKFDELKCYLSHISLVKTDNSEVNLADVTFLNFADPNTLVLHSDNITGDFKALKFSTGLDSVQNATDPLSVPSNNPLSNDIGMYWPWLKYIFYKLEARSDTTGTGNGTFNWFPLYHIGTNSMYRQATLEKPFSVCCDNEFHLTLYLDVKKIFYGNTQTLDIISESSTQMGTSDNPNIAIKFSDNFAQAFTF